MSHTRSWNLSPTLLALLSLLLLFGGALTATQARAAAVPTLNPATIPHFVEPLTIPPVMKPNGQGKNLTQYQIAVRQFQQQVLPSGYPLTTVWGYGRKGDPLPGPGIVSSFNFPAFTIEAETNKPIQVTWINQLVDDPNSATPLFLPHLFPLDQTLHWANPVGPRDSRGIDPAPYTGPVPIVTHLHGAHVADHSDGYPEAWYLPKAANIPAGYFTQGSHYTTTRPGPAGSAVYQYSNDQRATTLWYHDHALGMTRLNVYAGLAGFWLIRDSSEAALNLPGPAPQLKDKPGTAYYEIPIVIQDRSFNDDGSLFYPDSREFFDGFTGPFIPDPASDVSAIWNPEFFGNTIVVNGKTWPYLDVEPRKYRLRLLNGSNSRFLVLTFDQPVEFIQIGSDGGLLPAKVISEQLLLAPAERADVIIDFSAFNGELITMLNVGPDAPFGGLPIDPAELADPATTGQVMQFKVGFNLTTPDTSSIPSDAALYALYQNPSPASATPLRDVTPTSVRDLTLNEKMSILGDMPIAAELGTGAQGPLMWGAPITENPQVGDVEEWRIINLTEDAHPIHLHLVQFQILERVPFDAEGYADAQALFLMDTTGSVAQPAPLDFATDVGRAPETNEMGWKDTVIAYPGEVTRIIAKFDLPGLYVWHCHILEHEDNEMMRPYYVGPIPAAFQ